MVDVEYIQDDIYYWLVFTVFFGSVSVIGSALFVISYKIMVKLRIKRLRSKAHEEFGLVPDFDDVKQNFSKGNK